MQAPFDIPADLDTPVSAYLKLTPFGRRFLLESVVGAERQARYSFLGFGRADEVRLDAAGLRCGANEPTLLPPGSAPPAVRRTALLDSLRAALRETPRLAPSESGAPFAGGLVGLSGYGLARYFERLPPTTADPTLPDFLAYAPESVLVFDHETRRMALFCSGSQAERRALRNEVLRALRGPLPSEPALGSRGMGELRPTLDRASFVERVATAQEAIAAGEVYQLVLSSRFEAACDLDPCAVYRALRLVNPSPYMFLFEFPDLALVGASPEALVQLERGHARVQPIAGTRPRGDDERADRLLEEELLADPKEAAEHAMLVDLARNDLGRVARTGSVCVTTNRSIQRFSHVMHLVSTVTGELEAPNDAFDLFASTFPAGTVVGAPKLRAMELIDELEPSPRGLYAGAVGSFGRCTPAEPQGSMNQAIAIRTLMFRAGRVSFQAGAGIVSDSRPAAEYDEVLAKGGAMRRALALAPEVVQ